MTYNSGKSSKELWAVVDENENIIWTNGGSSSVSKLMVYETEGKARGAMRYAPKIYVGIKVMLVYKNEH